MNDDVVEPSAFCSIPHQQTIQQANCSANWKTHSLHALSQFLWKLLAPKVCTHCRIVVVSCFFVVCGTIENAWL
jgi:hypothetical protein